MGETLDPVYFSADARDLDRAAHLAATAFPVYRDMERSEKPPFCARSLLKSKLSAIRSSNASWPSRLPEARVRGERARTCFQLGFLAGIVEEGSWVDARIDTAEPERKPAPKSDLRSVLRWARVNGVVPPWSK